MKVTISPYALRTPMGAQCLSALGIIAECWGNVELGRIVANIMSRPTKQTAILTFNADTCSCEYVPNDLYHRNIPSITDVITINNNVIKMGDNTFEPGVAPLLLTLPSQKVENGLISQKSLDNVIQLIADAVLEKLEQKMEAEEKTKANKKPRIYAKQA